MAKHHDKGEMDRAESGVGHNELVTPLDYTGRKGGNPLSPSPVGLSGDPDDAPDDVLQPRDPMGLLPKDATGRGKRGGAY